MATLRDKLLISKIQEIQSDNNWTDTQTAEKLGLRKQAYSAIKNGLRPIGKIVYSRILERLELTEDEVFRPKAPAVVEGKKMDTKKIYETLLDIQSAIMDLQRRMSVLESNSKTKGRGVGIGGDQRTIA